MPALYAKCPIKLGGCWIYRKLNDGLFDFLQIPRPRLLIQQNLGLLEATPKYAYPTETQRICIIFHELVCQEVGAKRHYKHRAGVDLRLELLVLLSRAHPNVVNALYSKLGRHGS